MTDMTCCPLGTDDGDLPSVCNVKMRRAVKDHTCSECSETIPRGAQYEHVKGLWDGSWLMFKTCPSCVEIRTHFACEGRWVYGELWSQLEESLFPDMKAGGPCMKGLSPAAKGRLFERRLQWMEDSQ